MTLAISTTWGVRSDLEPLHKRQLARVSKLAMDLKPRGREIRSEPVQRTLNIRAAEAERQRRIINLAAWLPIGLVY